MSELNPAVSIYPAESLLAVMDIDIGVNEEAQVIVLHDKPFPFIVNHLEFSRATGDLHFGGTDGSLHPFGMKVPRKTCGKLAGASEVHLVMVEMTPKHRIVGHAQVFLEQKE